MIDNNGNDNGHDNNRKNTFRIISLVLDMIHQEAPENVNIKKY